MIAVADYDAGNIMSVANALSRLGAEYVLTSDPETVRTASKLILPGVGNDAEAMAKLVERGLVEPIRARRKPVLGICVGMQVLCRHSEEGDVDCVGLFDCDVRRLEASPDAKVPNMGWCPVGNLDSKLFKGVESGTFLYFVHSYAASLCTDTIATCLHGGTLFSAALKYENFYGTQFHPEKSGEAGERILSNFLSL